MIDRQKEISSEGRFLAEVVCFDILFYVRI